MAALIATPRSVRRLTAPALACASILASRGAAGGTVARFPALLRLLDARPL